MPMIEADDRALDLERMTWPEVEHALAAGWTTAVLACGAVEQHGPHLPLFVDAEHGTALARAVARRLGHALVVPTLRIGCSDHHMDFPGTLSLAAETFVAVCRDVVRSLARHGFRRIVLVPTHGGNFGPLRDALPELRRAAGDAVRLQAYTDLDEVLRTWRRAVAAAGAPPEGVGGHADVAETSLMLALHPGLVRRDRARPGPPGPTDDARLERVFREGFRAVTPTGVLGDPSGMSAEAGRRCLDALADAVVASLEREG